MYLYSFDIPISIHEKAHQFGLYVTVLELLTYSFLKQRIENQFQRIEYHGAHTYQWLFTLTLIQYSDHSQYGDDDRKAEFKFHHIDNSPSTKLLLNEYGICNSFINKRSVS